ncbi:hypothetical protein EYZ11_009001 [Aspergillus tanneri]|uniref:Uncharacterized protein n=1 Tax=Aspergillus tanneri TaxID=1220188 RepID=A0A4S3JB67_9EURO|nr:hypothetical protein EYZ11_009001 [Aspergillus tanneri]
MAWDRDSISSYKEEYILQLNHSQLEEISGALHHFKSLGKPLELLDPTTFPLPSLHYILRGVSDNIHSGTGFTLAASVAARTTSIMDILQTLLLRILQI